MRDAFFRIEEEFVESCAKHIEFDRLKEENIILKKKIELLENKNRKLGEPNKNVSEECWGF